MIISCSIELSMKKNYVTSGPGLKIKAILCYFFYFSSKAFVVGTVLMRWVFIAPNIYILTDRKKNTIVG